MYRAGVTASGWYQLDTTGGKNNADDRQVNCWDGWTEILRRNPSKTYYREVQTSPLTVTPRATRRATGCYN